MPSAHRTPHFELRTSHLNCVCVVKELPIAGYSVVKESVVVGLRSTVHGQNLLIGSPFRASAILNSISCGPTFARFASFSAQPSRGLPIHLRALRYGGQAVVGLPTEARLGVSAGERSLVENTGLEPVTSWLQTRRSPS
jgi:hypothetical protein